MEYIAYNAKLSIFLSLNVNIKETGSIIIVCDTLLTLVSRNLSDDVTIDTRLSIGNITKVHCHILLCILLVVCKLYSITKLYSLIGGLSRLEWVILLDGDTICLNTCKYLWCISGTSYCTTCLDAVGCGVVRNICIVVKYQILVEACDCACGCLIALSRLIVSWCCDYL